MRVTSNCNSNHTATIRCTSIHNQKQQRQQKRTTTQEEQEQEEEQEEEEEEEEDKETRCLFNCVSRVPGTVPLMLITSSRVCQDHLSTPYSITLTVVVVVVVVVIVVVVSSGIIIIYVLFNINIYFKMNKKLLITTSICFLITGLLFNSVVGEDDEINDNLKIIKNKKLSSLSSSLIKLKKNDGYIELKDPPILRVTPISLFDFDYKSSQENVYEEMDELLKLKLKSSLDNRNIKRGDMDPTVDYSPLEDKIDDKVPVRGDIVTRNKRSHNNYDYDDNYDDDDDYYYDDDNDQLWGFSESDGIDLINKDYNNNNNDKLINEFKNKLTVQELNNRQTEEELERKLKDYIARNRPIVLRNRKIINKDNYQENVQKLNDIPVSARIIIDKNKQINSRPTFESRNDFERDVDFPEINPNRKGIQVENFPVAPRPPSSNYPPPPGACVWAIVQCCPRSSSSATKENFVDQRVINCFEYMACPGVANWNPTLCHGPIANIARTEILKYYAHSS